MGRVGCRRRAAWGRSRVECSGGVRTRPSRSPERVGRKWRSRSALRPSAPRSSPMPRTRRRPSNESGGSRRMRSSGVPSTRSHGRSLRRDSGVDHRLVALGPFRCSSGGVAVARAREDDPSSKSVGEVLEVVRHARLDDERVACHRGIGWDRGLAQHRGIGCQGSPARRGAPTSRSSRPHGRRAGPSPARQCCCARRGSGANVRSVLIRLADGDVLPATCTEVAQGEGPALEQRRWR